MHGTVDIAHRRFAPGRPRPEMAADRRRLALLLTTVCVLVAPAGTAHAETAPGRFVPVQPCRLLDTRESPAKPLAAGNVAKVTGGRPLWRQRRPPSLPRLTLTAIEPDASGYATMFPAGGERPVASALNYAPGETIANMQLVQLGADGAVSVYTLRSAHFVST